MHGARGKMCGMAVHGASGEMRKETVLGTRGKTREGGAQGTSGGVRDRAVYRSRGEVRGRAALGTGKKGRGEAVHGASGEICGKAGKRTWVQHARAVEWEDSPQWNGVVGILRRAGGETEERDRLVKEVAEAGGKSLQREQDDLAKVGWELRGELLDSLIDAVWVTKGFW